MPAYTPRDPHDPEYDPQLEIESEWQASLREVKLLASHVLTFVAAFLLGGAL